MRTEPLLIQLREAGREGEAREVARGLEAG